MKFTKAVWDKKSFETELRAKIINKSVKVEYLVTALLKRILNINSDSKSFGTSNASLSFFAKVNLLSDLSFVDKELSTKLNIYMFVRNKFAHVMTVIKFDDFLNGAEYNTLKKLYSSVKLDDANEEAYKSLLFDTLTEDIFTNLANLEEILADRYSHIMTSNLMKSSLTLFYEKISKDVKLSQNRDHIKAIYEVCVDEVFKQFDDKPFPPTPLL